MNERKSTTRAAAATARPTLTRGQLGPAPLLEALRAAGTKHVYGDTADIDELARTIFVDGSAAQEVDGNTVNQPLVKQVLPRLIDEPDTTAAAHAPAHGANGRSDHAAWNYAILCARIGNEMTRAFAAGRPWDVSLQLHMGLVASYDEALRVGTFLHDMVPNALVKVPFAPDRPHTLLVARDLERAGVGVNLTSTFSARQVVVAALLADVSRTNVFLGRIEQGLEGERLGEHVVLEAQRALRALRDGDGIVTQLIAASMREWRSFERLAGCDAFTAPCDVLSAFLRQDEVAPDDVRGRLDEDDDFRVGETVLAKLGREQIARMYDVEPELVDFLHDLRAMPDWTELTDGDELFERFDAAGFGDVFHSPGDVERAEARAAKLPKLDGVLVRRAALDACYSLLANADFEKHQAEIDAEIVKRD